MSLICCSGHRSDGSSISTKDRGVTSVPAAILNARIGELKRHSHNFSRILQMRLLFSASYAVKPIRLCAKGAFTKVVVAMSFLSSMTCVLLAVAMFQPKMVRSLRPTR